MLFVLVLAVAHGQFDPKPKAIRLGTDLTNIGYTIFAKNWIQYEFHADLEIESFFLVFDYGTMDRTWERTNYVYNTNGNYYRLGIDHNFLNKKEGHDVIFIGFRYSRSNYADEMTWTINEGVFGEATQTDRNPDLSASWIEMVMGLKVQIWKGLFLGMTGRLKLAPSVKGEEQLISFEIPGYGRAASPSYWGFNYHIFWRIPFSKGDNSTVRWESGSG